MSAFIMPKKAGESMNLGAAISLKDNYTATMIKAQKATKAMIGTMDGAKKAARDMSSDFKSAMEDAMPDNMFDAIGSAGKKITAMGVAGAGAIGLATKAAIDQQDAFAGVRKTVSATEEEYQAMHNQIRKMTKDIPATYETIAGVTEAAGQLGVQKDNIMDFSRVMIDLGNTTNMSADQAATALARFANVTQMNQEQFDRLGSTIAALDVSTATSAAEIVELGTRLAGAGAQIGMTEAQIMSFSAALSSVGIEAEAGGSAFSKLMINMANSVSKGDKQMKKFAKVAGMSGKEFQKAFKDDAAGAVIEFIEGLGRIQDEGGNTFEVLEDLGITEVRMRDALLRAAGAGDLFRESMETGTKAWEENTALADMSSKRYGTAKAQLQILRNTLSDVAATIGTALLPQLNKLLDPLKNLAERFDNLPDPMKETISKGMAMATALALIGGPILILISKLPALIAGFKTFGSITGNILRLSVNPLSLGLTALVAGGVILYKNWDKVKEKAQPLINAFGQLKERARTVKEGFGTLGTTLKIVKNDAIDWTSDGFANLTSKMVDLKDAAIDKTVDGLNTFKNTMIDLKDGAVQWTIDKLDSFKQMLIDNQKAIKITTGILGTVFGPALIKTGIEAATAGGKVARNFIVSIIESGKAAIVSGAQITANFIKTLITTGTQAVVNGAKVTANFITSLAKTGAAAVANGAKLSAGFIANIIKTGSMAVVNGAKLTTSFLGAIIRTGAQAVVSGAQITASFIASIVKTGIEAAKTAAIMTGQLIKAVVMYAVQGWQAVSVIAAQTGAWIANKAAMIASTAATGAATVAQKALNLAMMAAPYMWVVAAIGAVIVAGVALYKNWNTVKEKGLAAWNAIKTGISNVTTVVSNKMNEFKKDVTKKWQAIKDFFAKPVQATVNFVQKGASKVKGWFGHARGLPRVPYDNYPALLHRNEMVLNRAEADRYRKRYSTLLDKDKSRQTNASENYRKTERSNVNITIPKLADRIDASNPNDIDDMLDKLEDRLWEVAANMGTV